MEYPKQLLMLLLLMFSRYTSAMPGVFSYMKREDEYTDSQPQVEVRKEELDDSTVIQNLQRDVQRLSQDLTDTKKQLELLRTEYETKLQHLTSKGSNSQEMSCRTDFTWWHETVGRSLEYLDNFDIHCRHGEFLRQWRMTWGERDRKKAIRYVCCHFKDASESDLTQR